MQYRSGVEIPKVSFSDIDYTQINSNAFFIGFDLDNLGKLSKIDEFGNITAIEGAGGGSSIMQEDTEPGSTVRIDNCNSASDCFSTVSGGCCNTINAFTTCSGYYTYGNTIGGGQQNTINSNSAYCGNAGGVTISGGFNNTT
jgi:hypothetical protein